MVRDVHTAFNFEICLRKSAMIADWQASLSSSEEISMMSLLRSDLDMGVEFPLSLVRRGDFALEDEELISLSASCERLRGEPAPEGVICRLEEERSTGIT